MQRDSFIFYRSFFEAANPLPDNEKLALFDSIISYALNQELSQLPPLAQAMFCLIKPQLDANHRRYENGSKGGRPKTEKKPKHNRKETKAKPNDNVNVNNNENGNDNSFAHFWQNYPRKVGKDKAKKAYDVALKKTTHEKLMEGLRRYCQDLQNKKTALEYIAHPTSWLNAGRWQDEYNSAPQRLNAVDVMKGYTNGQY